MIPLRQPSALPSSSQARTGSGADGWRRLAALQGAYYVATGLWSLLHLRSFQWITVRKTDTWLVKTVGVLVTVSGATLLQASRERDLRPSVVVLGAGSAAALAVVDFLYVAKRRIGPVYALDGVFETALAWRWLRGGAEAEIG